MLVKSQFLSNWFFGAMEKENKRKEKLNPARTIPQEELLQLKRGDSKISKSELDIDPCFASQIANQQRNLHLWGHEHHEAPNLD